MTQLLRVQNFTVSRDGFGAGEGQSLERPFGHANPGELMAWAIATAGFPSVKWNVVSDSENDGRRWWVMTNTGVWNGGSSPHQPSHSWSAHGPRCGPNLLRPMISAPMLFVKSRVK